MRNDLLIESAAAFRFASEFFWGSAKEYRNQWRLEVEENPSARNPLVALREAEQMLLSVALKDVVE
jgi:hypothetical protein